VRNLYDFYWELLTQKLAAMGHRTG
jgi:hypothetical protein